MKHTTFCEHDHLITFDVPWWRLYDKARKLAVEKCRACQANAIWHNRATVEAEPINPYITSVPFAEPDTTWQVARGPIVGAIQSGGGGVFDGGGASGRWEDAPLRSNAWQADPDYTSPALSGGSSANDPSPGFKLDDESKRMRALIDSAPFAAPAANDIAPAPSPTYEPPAACPAPAYEAPAPSPSYSSSDSSSCSSSDYSSSSSDSSSSSSSLSD